jgi:hypothetical protein
MSSASSYQYEVRRNEQLEAAALQAATSKANELFAAIERLRAEALELSKAESGEVEIPYLMAPPLSSGRTAIEGWIREGHGAVAALSSSIAEGRARRAERQMMSSLKKGVKGVVESIDEVFDRLPEAARPVETDPSTSSDWKSDLVAKAVSLAERAGGRVFESDRVALTDLVRQIVEAGSKGESEKKLDTLRFELQAALERGYERDQHRADASELLSKLRGLDGPDAPPVRAALEDVALGKSPLTGELAARAEVIVSQGRAEADREYAGRVLSEAFQALGYTVDPGFATELATGGSAELRYPEWEDYGVKLHLDDADGVRIHLVSYSDGSSAETDRRDLRVGEEFCESQELVRRAMYSQGVALKLVQEFRPGEMPLIRATKGQSRRAKPDQKVAPPKAMQRPRPK